MTKIISEKAVELKKKFIDVVNDYMYLWCTKHGYRYEKDMWVGDEYGGVCMVGDLFVNFNDVRYDMDNDLPEEMFEAWYWYSLELSELGSSIEISLRDYSEGKRAFSDDDLEKIRAAKKRVVESQRILEELVNRQKNN